MMRMDAVRRGFSLIELLCALVLIGVVTTVLALMIRETLEAERLQAEGFDHLLWSKTLADQFRADVAQAEAAPAQWKQYAANPGTLILQMKDQNYVIYLWREGKLDRHQFAKGEESERALSVGSRVGVEFVRAAPDAKLMRLRLSTLRGGKVVAGRTLEIAAALGGDWR